MERKINPAPLCRRAISGLALLLALVLTAAIAPAASAKTGQTVRVGFYVLNNYQQVGANQSYSGYSFDYLEEIAQYTGWDYQYIPSSRSRCLQLLRDGLVDLVNGVLPTAAMAESLSFSALPSSYAKLKLYAPAASSLAYGDYAAFDGATVALLHDDAMEQLLDDYCRTHGFTLKKVRYETREEVKVALRSGSAELVFSDDIDAVPGAHAVGDLGSTPLYFAVKKGNTALLAQLDAAIRKINAINPGFSDYLSRQYSEQHSVTPVFTQDELLYLEQNAPVTVLYDASSRPLEYTDPETGEFKGVFGELYRQIAQITGLRFVYRAAPSFAEALQQMQQGDADILSSFGHNYRRAKENNLYLSAPVLEAPIAMVRRSASSGSSPRSYALLRDQLISEQMESTILEGAAVQYYDTVPQCLDAVHNGDADVTYIDYYSANYFLSDVKYRDLYSVSRSDHSLSLALGVSQSTDPLLLSILNKALTCISKTTLDGIVLKNAATENHLSLSTLFYAHPAKIALLSVLLLGSIIAVLLFVMLRGRRRTQRIRSLLLESNTNNQRFQLALHQLECEVLEYDFRTGQLFVLNKRDGSRIPVRYSDTVSDSPYTVLGMIAAYPDMGKQIADFRRAALSGTRKRVYLLSGYRGSRTIWARLTLCAVTDHQGVAIRAIGTLEDITNKQEIQYDPLTGLLNRASLRQSASIALEGRLDGETRTFIMIDVDNFKSINDTYGHTAGDAALVQLACAIRACFRADDSVGRMGGDEFAVFLSNTIDQPTLEHKLAMLVQTLADIAIDIDVESPPHLSVSVGAAVCPQQGTDFDALYRNADRAMYEAKARGKNRFILYDEQVPAWN